MWIFAAFLALPLIEIGLFVTLGGALGLWLTLGFVMGSALLGGFILRRGALGVQKRRSGLMQLAGSGFSMLSALLLILPGFMTSFIGALLLIPLVQRWIVLVIGQRLTTRGFAFGAGPAAQDEVIDADYTVMPEAEHPLPPSKWTARD